MSTLKGTGKVQQMLNRMTPGANAAHLGDVLAAMITQVNLITTALQATTATGLVTTGFVALPSLENPAPVSIPGDYP